MWKRYRHEAIRLAEAELLATVEEVADVLHVLEGHVHVADVAAGRAAVGVSVLLADLVDEPRSRQAQSSAV